MRSPGRARAGLATGIVVALALGGCGGGHAKSDAGSIVLSGAAGAGGAAGTGGVAGSADDAGCIWDPGASSVVAGAAPAAGNSSDLRGPTIGDQSFDPAMQRRLVPVTVTTPLDGIQIGQAYLTRPDPVDETAYLTIPVANVGTAHPCFLVASPLRYKDLGGALLNADTDLSYVSGSVGDVGFGLYTESCLAPGDHGYFIDIQLAVGTTSTVFSSTTSVEIALAAMAGTATAGHLVPTGYEVGSCAGERTLRVSAVNDGTGSISVPSFGFPDGPTIFLDANGLPTGWTYVGATEALDLAPGATTMYTAPVIYHPAIARAQFFLAFGPPLTPTADASMLAALPDNLTSAVDALRASRQDLLSRWRSALARRRR